MSMKTKRNIKQAFAPPVFALHRHTRGWGLVTLHSSLLCCRQLFVRDNETGETYPVDPRHLKTTVTYNEALELP